MLDYNIALSTLQLQNDRFGLNENALTKMALGEMPMMSVCNPGLAPLLTLMTLSLINLTLSYK